MVTFLQIFSHFDTSIHFCLFNSSTRNIRNHCSFGNKYSFPSSVGISHTLTSEIVPLWSILQNEQRCIWYRLVDLFFMNLKVAWDVSVSGESTCCLKAALWDWVWGTQADHRGWQVQEGLSLHVLLHPLTSHGHSTHSASLCSPEITSWQKKSLESFQYLYFFGHRFPPFLSLFKSENYV